MEGRVSWTRDGGLDVALDHLERWRRANATRVAVNTMGAGLASVDEHVAALSTRRGGDWPHARLGVAPVLDCAPPQGDFAKPRHLLSTIALRAQGHTPEPLRAA